MKRSLAILLIIAFITALPSCKEGRAETYSAFVTAMDTRGEIRVYGASHKAAADDCVALMHELDKQLSVTDKEGLVYQLNNSGETKLTATLEELCTAAISISAATNGAFNPFVYPLVRLWGFTTDSPNVPEKDAIEAACATVAGTSLSFEEESVRILGGGAVDFGGIAKGYAADKMEALLKEKGVDAAIISLGGNIKTIGTKPDGSPWTVGINSPKADLALLGVLRVGECAVVTSGSYIRNFTENGKTYHHIIDPSTGCPAETGLVSVTVVADSALVADSLATAFFVLGMEKARPIAEQFGVDTVFVTQDTIYVSGGLKEKFTPDREVEGVYTVVFD